MLLISEDKRFRALAGSMKVDGAWLQDVFFFAVHNGIITPEGYALLTAELASLRHVAVTLEARDIENVVEQSTPETKHRIFATASCIGVKHADEASHLSVLLEAINRLWSGEPTLNGKLATGLLIQNAIRHRPDRGARILRVVEGALSRHMGGSEYFANCSVFA